MRWIKDNFMLFLIVVAFSAICLTVVGGVVTGHAKVSVVRNNTAVVCIGGYQFLSRNGKQIISDTGGGVRCTANQ